MDAPAAECGVAAISVNRGAGPAIWATYSTRIGSPVGDSTGGAFRFTCKTAQAPCTVSVGAAYLSNGADTLAVWPRLLIQRQDYVNPGAQTYCEYGDGVADPIPFGLVAAQPGTSTPVYSPLTIHIGGSADCGLPGPAGQVPQITVPAGSARRVLDNRLPKTVGARRRAGAGHLPFLPGPTAPIRRSASSFRGDTRTCARSVA